MLIGIPAESLEGETRVAATPDSVAGLIRLGFSVTVEKGAGIHAGFSDNDYRHVGAMVCEDSATAFAADLVLKVNAPSWDEAGDGEIGLFKPGATLISFIWPAQNEALLKTLAEKKINVLAMDSIPRLSRSQSMDALSSMANIAGYRAVVEAANHFGRFFTGQITAAGKVPAAKVLVIGAGVAGLSALGTAASLGAIVRAFDTRPEVKEQITSMGAEFLEVEIEEEGGSGDGYAKVMSKAFIEAEMALFAEQAQEVDIIITTALIPGKPAPRLITAEMVASMKRGSVIVDLAAPNGGNCELCVSGEVSVTDNGVTIIGYNDLPGRLPAQSSQLYATNLVNLLKLLTPHKDGDIEIDFEDQVIRGATVVKDGEVTWPAPPIQVSAQPAQQKPGIAAEPELPAPKSISPVVKYSLLGAAALVTGLVANYAPAEFLSHFMIFVLACFIGYYVVWNVTHSLHTPLMSVTNAISGIIVVGALLQMGEQFNLVSLLAIVAVFIATINIVGGFSVTRRMLKMFQKEGD